MIEDIAVAVLGPHLAVIVGVGVAAGSIVLAAPRFVHWMDAPWRQEEQRIRERLERLRIGRDG